MTFGRIIHKIAIVVGALSLLLQVLGYACPGWVIVSVGLGVVSLATGSGAQGWGNIVSYTAVWYSKICIEGDDSTSCSHESFHDETEMGYHLSTTLNDLRLIDWTEVEVVLTLAIIFGIIGLVLAVIGLLGNPGISAKLMTSLASAAMLVSWVLILPAVIKVGLAIQDTQSAIDIYENNNGASYIEVRTPWALVLSAIGLILALIACVLLLISICQQDDKKSGSITPETPRYTPPGMEDDATLFKLPIGTSKILMREGTEPHIAPQYNQGMLPAIGSKDEAPLEKTDIGLTAYAFPLEPPIDYDSESLPPSTPPMDTSMYPQKGPSRQNTTVSEVIRVESRENVDKNDTKQAGPNQSESDGKVGDDRKSSADDKHVKGKNNIKSDLSDKLNDSGDQMEDSKHGNKDETEDNNENKESSDTAKVNNDKGTRSQFAHGRNKTGHKRDKNNVTDRSPERKTKSSVIVPLPAHRDKNRKFSPYTSSTSPKKSKKFGGSGLEFV